MAVTEADVRTIASLARLRISDEQLPSLVEQMNGILGHVDVLAKVDASRVATAVGEKTPGMSLRDDTVAPIPMQISAEGLTSQSRDGFILVPRLSTHMGS
jgi:aspartyl-tRNA(Asn)/glutamyl-tRNA(Gln) amidotransferase subunit C